MAFRRYRPELDKEEEDEIKNVELDEEELKLKVTSNCNCDNCKHWLTSNDWSTPPDFNVTKKTNCNSSETKTTAPLLFIKGESSLNKLKNVEVQTALKVLIHGSTIPEPIISIKSSLFHEAVHNSLKRLDYMQSRNVQSYTWPAVYRKLNTVIIDSPESGKTLGYLPSLLSLLLENQLNLQQLSKHKGPAALILCSNTEQCEVLYDLIITMKISHNFFAGLLTYPVADLAHKYIDLMITTPTILLECLQNRMFSLKRLCHIILEDASCLLKTFEQATSKIFSLIDEVLQNRFINLPVQLIIVSERWSDDIRNVILKLNAPPLICIGDNLEAALYGGVEFKINFVKTSHKNKALDFIKNHWSVHRTVLFCDNSKIPYVNVWLRRKGIKTICISDDDSKDDVERKEMEWKSCKQNFYQVLLCTDFMFNSILNISEAEWVIHYSLAESWRRFVKRFYAFSKQLIPLMKSTPGKDLRCFILADEYSTPQLAKILNIVTRLQTDSGENVQDLYKSFVTDQEMDKIKNEIELCPTLKLLGQCSNAFCANRHLINSCIDVSDDLPQSGTINFKILKILNPTQYLIQIYEAHDIDDNVFRYMQQNYENVSAEELNLVSPASIKANQIYFIVQENQLTLGKVLKILSKDYLKLTILKTKTCIQCNLKDVFELPSNLKIVEIFLANMLPPFEDTNFSTRAYQKTISKLNKINFNNIIFTGKIQLQLYNTLWVSEVIEIVKAIDTNVIKINLINHLQNSKVAINNCDQINKLRSLCAKCEIKLPKYVKRISKPLEEREETKTEAFLDEIEMNEVHLASGVSAGEFYVRLAKFSKLVEDLDKEITMNARNGFLELNEAISIGKYYSALDPRNEQYCRVLILNKTEEEALCFAVDYGDEYVTKISEIKTLPIKYRNKLPFQAIQCSLQGVLPNNGEWTLDSVDFLYNYMFEPESNFYRNIYLKVCDKSTINNFPTTNKYSVLLIDKYEIDKPAILLNKLLAETGLALNENIEEFDFDGYYNSLENADGIEEICNQSVDDLEDDDNDGYFDIVIHNEAGLLKEMINQPCIEHNKSIPENTTDITQSCSNLTQAHNGVSIISAPIVAVEHNDGLTPEIYWSQTSNNIRIKIKLIGVKEYTVEILRRRIFVFSTLLEEKKYYVKYVLSNAVRLEKHYAKGQEVEIILKKLGTTEEWLQLTASKQRYKNIHFEILDKDLMDEPKRRILQLDITDSESEDDDEKPMYLVESDLDSDLDFELSSESDTD